MAALKVLSEFVAFAEGEPRDLHDLVVSAQSATQMGVYAHVFRTLTPEQIQELQRELRAFLRCDSQNPRGVVFTERGTLTLLQPKLLPWVGLLRPSVMKRAKIVI